VDQEWLFGLPIESKLVEIQVGRQGTQGSVACCDWQYRADKSQKYSIDLYRDGELRHRMVANSPMYRRELLGGRGEEFSSKMGLHWQMVRVPVFYFKTSPILALGSPTTSKTVATECKANPIRDGFQIFLLTLNHIEQPNLRS